MTVTCTRCRKPLPWHGGIIIPLVGELCERCAVRHRQEQRRQRLALEAAGQAALFDSPPEPLGGLFDLAPPPPARRRSARR